MKAREQLSRMMATNSSAAAVGSSRQSTNIQKNSTEIAVPGRLDIVLGRGSHSRNSPAYARFRTVLEKHRETYDNAERCHKMVIANQVLAELLESGSRFLKMTPNGILIECDVQESEKKISHAFRNMRLRAKKKRNSHSIGKVESSKPSIPTNRDAATASTPLVAAMGMYSSSPLSSSTCSSEESSIFNLHGPVIHTSSDGDTWGNK